LRFELLASFKYKRHRLRVPDFGAKVRVIANPRDLTPLSEFSFFEYDRIFRQKFLDLLQIHISIDWDEMQMAVANAASTV